ncbi:MAG: PAS domain-containing protein [bacterium]|nr:PAS domain-containing protein [bacterium]
MTELNGGAERRKPGGGGISLARAMVLSLSLILVFFGIAVCSLVWLSMDKVVAELQEDHLKSLQEGIETEISTFLTDRRTILRDLVRFPVMVQGVMQPEIAWDNLADFLDATSLLGSRPQLSVLDFRGEVIHRTQGAPLFEYTGCSWLPGLMDDAQTSHIGISGEPGAAFWRIAVPIVYNGLPEGILVTEIPLMNVNSGNRLSRILGSCQLQFIRGSTELASLGTPVDSPHEIIRMQNVDLTLHFHLDRTAIVNNRRALLARIIAFMLSLILLGLLIGVAIGKKALILPLTQLREWTSSLGESLDAVKTVETRRIREVNLLARDFEGMVQRLQIRDRALRRAHDTLETRVEERTRELENESHRRELILRGIGDGVIVTDLESRVTLLNRVAREMIEVPAEVDYRRRLLADLLPLDDESGARVVGTLADDSGETEWVLDTEDAKSLRVTYNAFKDESGEKAGYVLILHDVTLAREVSRMKTDFVSSVSHELRTPLTSIKGFTATILRDPAMPEETRIRFLNIVDEESSRLTNLVEDLLEISRIESGSIQVALSPVQIEASARGALDSLDQRIEKKGLRYSFDSAGGLPPALCDPQKARTVLTNLIENAVKFTPEGGHIAVKVARAGEYIEVAISDTGVGIAEREQEKIFERFYRSNRPGLKVPGTGLGLSIVKDLVEMQNGKVAVTSRINEGSTFTVAFRVAP